MRQNKSLYLHFIQTIVILLTGEFYLEDNTIIHIYNDSMYMN